MSVRLPQSIRVTAPAGGLGLGSSLTELTARALAVEAGTIAVPQFGYSPALDPRTWQAIDRFEQRVVREHARSDDPDPVFFGPNTSLWFKALLKRDVGELGVDAIVTSGVMLWGRFQKTVPLQRRVEGWLRLITARAKMEFNLHCPDPELWWGPVWARAVKDPQATPELLAAILQRVREDQSRTPAYQGDLVEIWLGNFMLDFHDSARAFDVHEEIQRLLPGSLIAVNGRRRGRDAEASAFLSREALRHHWDLVNQRLVEVYPDALAEEGLADCIVRVALLRDALNLRFAPTRILPKVSSTLDLGTQWGPIATQLTEVAHAFLAFLSPPSLPPPRGPGHRQVMLPPPPPTPTTPPEREIFHWAHCGFALAVLGDPRAGDCFGKVRALLPTAIGLSDDDKRYLADLRHGTAAPDLRDKLKEIVEEAQEGLWAEALAGLKLLTDPGERMEALAGLARQYRDQRVNITLQEGQVVKIGRARENELRLDDPRISHKHAQLSLVRGAGGGMEVQIQDLGSRNGTYFPSSGTRLPAGQSYPIPRGESVRLSEAVTIYNAMGEVQPGDEVVLRCGLEPGEWVIQTKRSTATPPPAEPTKNIPWFQRLPKRDRESVLEKYRYLIPDENLIDRIVQFPRFERILNEASSMIASPERIGVRFFGPPGTGKTTIPDIIAGKMGVPILRFTFSPRTDPSDVEGMWDFEMVPVLDDGGQPVMGDDGVTPRMEYIRAYKEGVATVSMENGFHLVWDEPDLGRPGVLAFLNNVSAPGEYAWVKKKDGKLERIKVHPGYRCYVTENGVREIAREEHGEDFLRRFVPYYVGPWTAEEITPVLTELYEVQGGKRNWSHKVSEVLAMIHDRLSFLASSFEDPVTHAPLAPLGSAIQQSVEFTPRSILRLAERLIRQGPQGSMTPETLSRAIRAEYILPLADPDDRAMVWQQIQPILQPLLAEMGWAADAIGPQAIPVPTLKEIERKYLGGRRVPQDGFKWTEQAIRVVDETLWNRSLGIDVMWLGDAGVGKTRTPEQISKILGLNHFTGEMSGATEEGDLVGIPGPTGFQPGLVTLGVEHGGLVHLDEFLLLQPGRFESVFGPLMDNAQALFIKNPYRRIDRVPGKTFFLFTSNPPFGNFAGKDRYEQSGAAMSRMAVMCLTGEFGMTPKDRLDIRMHEPPPAAVRVPLPDAGKKKALTASPPRTGEAGRVGSNRGANPDSPPDTPHRGDDKSVLKMAEPAPTQQNRFPVVEVHPDFQQGYGLPSHLAVDLESLEVLEPDGSGGFRKASDATKEGLDRLSEYIRRRTQFEMTPVVKRVIPMSFRFFGPQFSNLATHRACFNIIDLLRFSMLGALGVGKHEWAHQILNTLHPKYFAHEPGRLLYNVMGDPLMQEFVAWLASGLFRPQAEAVNETQWPVVWNDDDQKRWLATRLPHEQFAGAVIHFWRTGTIMPWIVDDKVREALDEAKPFLTAAAHALPKSLSDDDIDEAKAVFVDQVDLVWPIYEKLFPEGMKKILERLEAGEKPEDIIGEILGNLLGDIIEGMIEEAGGDPEKLAKAIFEARAGILADRHEPNDPEKFAERKGRIEGIRQGSGGVSGKGTLPLPPPPPPPAAPSAGLSAGEIEAIQVGLREVDRQQVEGNLYRELIAKVPKAARLLARLKKILPPASPTHMDGHYRSGRRPDPKKMHQNDMAPVPDPREMLKNAIPSDVEGSIVVATDVSYSMVMSGANEHAMIASAVSIYLSEGLNLRYGELVFGSKVESAKPLGKRLGSYALKNEMLNKKKQAFFDGNINGQTDIRRALAKAIEWVKTKRSKADHIILITDGGENITDYPKTLEELEAECEREGIDLMILAMGQAQAFIPQHFKPEHYRFVAPDGSDIPDIMVDMFEKAHRRRLPKRR